MKVHCNYHMIFRTRGTDLKYALDFRITLSMNALPSIGAEMVRPLFFKAQNQLIWLMSDTSPAVVTGQSHHAAGCNDGFKDILSKTCPLVLEPSLNILLTDELGTDDTEVTKEYVCMFNDALIQVALTQNKTLETAGPYILPEN